VFYSLYALRSLQSCERNFDENVGQSLDNRFSLRQRLRQQTCWSRMRRTYRNRIIAALVCEVSSISVAGYRRYLLSSFMDIVRNLVIHVTRIQCSALLASSFDPPLHLSVHFAFSPLNRRLDRSLVRDMCACACTKGSLSVCPSGTIFLHPSKEYQRS